MPSLTDRKKQILLLGDFPFSGFTFALSKHKTTSKEIRQMIDKVKNFKQFVNESDNDFILNNDNVKTYTWTSGGKEHTIKYHLSRDIFKGFYDAVLLGGEFPNTYGQGETEKDAVESLKLRVIRLRNKRDGRNF
jgi:hypothetical protein